MTKLIAPGSASLLRPLGVYGGIPAVGQHGGHVGPYGALGGTNQTSGNFQIGHKICTSCTDIRFVYQNWTGAGGETSGTNSIIIMAGLQGPDGTILPVYFRGSRTFTLAPDGVIVSDPVPIEVTAGQVIYSRTRVLLAAGTGDVTSGSNQLTNVSMTQSAYAVGDPIAAAAGATLGIPAGTTVTAISPDGKTITMSAVSTATNAGIALAGQKTPVTRITFPTGQPITGEGNEFSSTTTDKTLSGTINQNQSYAYSPHTVLGVPQPNVTAQPQVAVVGDSIPSGANDTLSYADFEGGFVVRAFEALSIPFLMVARGGETAAAFAALSTSRRRRHLLTGCTHALCTYGTNDVFGSASLATVQASLLTIWTAMAARGMKVLQTTITPRTNSTNNWIDLAHQTTVNAGQETVRRNLNAWIRAGSPIDPNTKAAVAVGTAGALLAGNAGHPLSAPAAAPLGYIEIADLVESARDSGLYKVPGIVTTGDITTDSNVIANVASTAGFNVGDAIGGPNLPAGVTIQSLTANSITLLAGPNGVNATATTAGITFGSQHTYDGIHPLSVLHSTTMQAALSASLFV